MLDCIHHDVHEYRVALAFVKFDISYSRIEVCYDDDALFPFFVSDISDALGQPSVEVSFFNLEIVFADFHLSEVKYHIQEIFHP